FNAVAVFLGGGGGVPPRVALLFGVLKVLPERPVGGFPIEVALRFEESVDGGLAFLVAALDGGEGFLGEREYGAGGADAAGKLLRGDVAGLECPFRFRPVFLEGAGDGFDVVGVAEDEPPRLFGGDGQ